VSDDRTCPHGKPINHDCGLCDLGQGAISRGPDPRDAEIARLREDVARLREERDRLVPFAAVPILTDRGPRRIRADSDLHQWGEVTDG
jgi:hypothetical protein